MLLFSLGCFEISYDESVLLVTIYTSWIRTSLSSSRISCTKTWTWVHINKSSVVLFSKRKLLDTACPSFWSFFLLYIFLSSSHSCWGIINKASPESFPSSVQLTSPRNCPLPYTNASACENKIKANFSIKLVQIGRQQCTYPCTTIPPISKSTENFSFSLFSLACSILPTCPLHLLLLGYLMLLVKPSSWNRTSFSLISLLFSTKTVVTLWREIRAKCKLQNTLYSITICTEHSPSWEADSFWTSQENPCIL